MYVLQAAPAYEINNIPLPDGFNDLQNEIPIPEELWVNWKASSTERGIIDCLLLMMNAEDVDYGMQYRVIEYDT